MEDFKSSLTERFRNSNQEKPKETETVVEQTTLPTKEQQSIENFNALKDEKLVNVVRAVQNKKALDLAEKDETIKAQMDENAKQFIGNSMQVVANETTTQVNKSYFELHKSANKMYGFKEERPRWQQKMMVFGNSIWFVIYFIIATFTVCPLSVFFDVFRNIFKKGWLSMIVSILVYLAITFGIPLLTGVVNVKK